MEYTSTEDLYRLARERAKTEEEKEWAESVIERHGRYEKLIDSKCSHERCLCFFAGPAIGDRLLCEFVNHGWMGCDMIGYWPLTERDRKADEKYWADHPEIKEAIFGPLA